MAHNGGVQQYGVVPLRLGFFNVRVLSVFGGGVEDNRGAVLVRLEGLDFVDVLVQGEETAVGILNQEEFFRTLKEFLVRDHSVLNNHLDIVPLGFKVCAVCLEHFLQLVRYLFGDVAADFLDVAVCLEVRSRNV